MAQLHRTHDDRLNARGDEEIHGGETKSPMQKVEKSKDTITYDHGHQDETEIVNSTPAVMSGVVQPTVMGVPVLMEDLHATHSNIADPPTRSFAQWETEEKHGDPPPLSTEYYPTHLSAEHEDRHGAPPPRSAGSYETRSSEKDERHDDPQESTGVYVMHPGGNEAYAQDFNREQPVGGFGKSTGMQKDPNAPSMSTASPPNYQSKVVDPTNAGGKEVGITGVLKSFDKMGVYDEPETESSKSDQNAPNAYTGSHDQFKPDQVDNPPLDTIAAADPSNKNSSYTQRTSAKSAITNKATGMKDSVMSKIHGPGHVDTTESPATTVPPESKGVTRVTEYLVESFEPGDDDKVLSEPITNALHRGNAPPDATTTTTTTTYVIKDGKLQDVQDAGN